MATRVITSQAINHNAAAKFAADMHGTNIVMGIVPTYMIDDSGNDLYILADDADRYAAAIDAGLIVDFDVIDDDMSPYDAIDNHDGNAICASWWMGSDWRYIDDNTYVW